MAFHWHNLFQLFLVISPFLVIKMSQFSQRKLLTGPCSFFTKKKLHKIFKVYLLFGNKVPQAHFVHLVPDVKSTNFLSPNFFQRKKAGTQPWALWETTAGGSPAMIVETQPWALWGAYLASCWWDDITYGPFQWMVMGKVYKYTDKHMSKKFMAIFKLVPVLLHNHNT